MHDLPGPNGDGGEGGPAAHASSPYMSMSRIQSMAACLNLGEDPSLNELLRLSQDAVEQAARFAQQGKYDFALSNYFRASDIALNTIPRHPDFSYVKSHHPTWTDQFSKLLATVNSQHEKMEKFKRIITRQNSSPRRRSSTDRHSYPSSSTVNPPIRMPSPSSFQHASNNSKNPNNLDSREPPGKGKPEVKPKPPVLAGRPISEIPASSDVLSRRFSELQNRRGNGNLTSSEHAAFQNGKSDVSFHHRAMSHAPLSKTPRVASGQSHPPPSRPQGPRSMNSPRDIPPSIPAKVPLTTNAALPKYPSPAYSPVWSIPSQPPSNPPRTSSDSLRNLNYTQSNTRINSPGKIGTPDNVTYYSTPNGEKSENESTERFPDISVGAAIRAETLLEYMRKYDILLVDIRTRDNFDSGHIYAKSVMCIEPVALKENIAADELEERLVISPEAEQALFSRLNEYDLVVYYDQSTTEPSYLKGSPATSSKPHLRAFYDTLYEFNPDKPLKGGRPPALLLGGLDAWIDLVGPQSLATSRTAAILSSVLARKPVRSEQPRRRVSKVSANSSWEVRKRRLRDHVPLDPEEERLWLEKMKTEEINPTYVSQDGVMVEEPETIDSSSQQTATQYVHSYEDFLKRFPEPQDVRESMTGPINAAQFRVYDQVPIAPPSRPPPAIPRPSYSGVIDRGQIQPPLARQSSAHKQALYSSPFDRMRLPRTGLVNFGSTCYMNSIIQCLSATVQLTKFFVDNRFHTQVQKNWKGSQGVLPGLYANLIRSLWKNDVQVIRPTSFRKFIGRLNADWSGNQQQDAKEFFDVLVDCLHEDLNLNWERTQLKPLTFEQEKRREQMPIPDVSGIEWNRYCHREKSYISSLFAGQHASRLKCKTCGRTSTTYEAFYSISVEIPPTGTGNIYQCLQSYCQEEMLSGDEVWKCPYCKREREATKQIFLTRAPRFLVVHFKRFSASRRQKARKIHTPIDFPLVGLDMSPFMIQHPPPTEAANLSSPPPSASSTSLNSSNEQHRQVPQSELTPFMLATSSPYLYNAYAVVRHLGASMHEGHYIALAKDPLRECWRRFDDQRATDFKPGNSPASPEHIQNQQAYLVFYERALAS